MFAARPGGLKFPARPPLSVAVSLTVVGLLLMVIVRLGWLAGRPLPVAWSVPLILSLWFRRHWLLWVAAAAYVAISFTETVLIDFPRAADLAGKQRAINFALELVNILVLAGFLHLLISLVDEAEHRARVISRTVGELTAVWRSAPVGLCLASADLSDVRINPHGAALLGGQADENIAAEMRGGRYQLWRDGQPVSPEHHPVTRAARDNVFVDAVECDLAGPNGRRITVLLAAAPVRDPEPHGANPRMSPPAPGRASRADGAIAAFVDITAAKALQRELDLRRREAEEASVRKTRFLSAVSHDIRTPANAISLLAELLGHASATPAMIPEIPGFARDLRSSAQKLVELVSDVLDFTKLDAGRVEVVESTFNLNGLIQDECGQASVLATPKGVSVRCSVPDDSVALRTDRVKLGRILGNLLSNAVKFTERGEITVSVEPTPVGDLFLRVRDTGRGIPPDALSRIFDEFYQVRTNSALSEPGRVGSGLGLAICRRLSIALGMRLEVESAVGQGTTFSLHIPSPLVLPPPPARRGSGAGK